VSLDGKYFDCKSLRSIGLNVKADLGLVHDWAKVQTDRFCKNNAGANKSETRVK
jgi:hypothetical protein